MQRNEEPEEIRPPYKYESGDLFRDSCFMKFNRLDYIDQEEV